jgi:hypothetical protein
MLKCANVEIHVVTYKCILLIKSYIATYSEILTYDYENGIDFSYESFNDIVPERPCAVKGFNEICNIIL